MVELEISPKKRENRIDKLVEQEWLAP